MRGVVWKVLGTAVLLLGVGPGLAPAQRPSAWPAPAAGQGFAQGPGFDTGPGDSDSGRAFREGAGTGENRQLSDLTLGNFFSEGWDEEWAKRQRPTGTPDFALLRVQTNFLEREFRANYFFENNINSKTREHINDFDALIAWSFNRRFMIEITGLYQWVDARTPPDISGGAPGLVSRVQLVDTESSSYSFNFRVLAPNQGLGQTQTTISYGVAGFEDLAYWLKLKKTGLYYSVLFDSLAGPRATGAQQNDVQYDVTVARTLLDPDVPLLGDFTVVLEAFAQTTLDGANAGQTLVSLTPEVRFNLGTVEGARFGKDNWILLGVDLPLAGPRPWDAVYRLSYIKNF
jgi:hypothetical protein